MHTYSSSVKSTLVIWNIFFLIVNNSYASFIFILKRIGLQGSVWFLKPHVCTGIPTDQIMRLRPREAKQLGQKLGTPPGVWNRLDSNSIHIEHSPWHPRMRVNGFAGQPDHTASSPAGRAQDPAVPRLTHPCSSAEGPAHRTRVPAARLLMPR